MQLRLTIINIAIPLVLLIVLGFIPEQDAPVPAYLHYWDWPYLVLGGHFCY